MSNAEVRGKKKFNMYLAWVILNVGVSFICWAIHESWLQEFMAWLNVNEWPTWWLAPLKIITGWWGHDWTVFEWTSRTESEILGALVGLIFLGVWFAGLFFYVFPLFAVLLLTLALFPIAVLQALVTSLWFFLLVGIALLLLVTVYRRIRAPVQPK